MAKKNTPAKRSTNVTARVKRAVRSHKSVAIGAAGLLGLAERYNIGLPAVPVLGPAGTYGLACELVNGMTGGKSKHLDAAGTGLICVAAHDIAAGRSELGADDDLYEPEFEDI